MIQTWLPFPSFKDSLRCLSDEHLDDERFNVLELLEFFHEPEESAIPLVGYEMHDLHELHPIVVMWRGYEMQLCEYGLEACEEWERRNERPDAFYLKIKRHMEWANTEDAKFEKPNWFGDTNFHLSHQAELLREDFRHYTRYFVIGEYRELIWPRSDYRAS